MVALGALVGAAPVGAARAPVLLEFRPVIAPVPSVAATPTTTAPVDLAAAKAAIAACDDAAVAQLTVIPTTTAAASEPDACVVFPDRGGKRAARYYLGPAGLTGRGLRTAKMEFVAGQGWAVKVDLTRAGAKAWDALAREQFHRQVAISVQGYVVSAPQIQPSEEKFTSFDGTAVISGNFSEKEANEIATIARLGVIDARR